MNPTRVSTPVLVSIPYGPRTYAVTSPAQFLVAEVQAPSYQSPYFRYPQPLWQADWYPRPFVGMGALAPIGQHQPLPTLPRPF